MREPVFLTLAEVIAMNPRQLFETMRHELERIRSENERLLVENMRLQQELHEAITYY